MNLKRCENGHFYDADKFAGCPHCAQPMGGNAAGDLTVGADHVSGEAVTVPMGGGQNPGAQPVVPAREIIKTPPVAPAHQPGSIRDDIQNIMTVPDDAYTLQDDEGVTVRYGSFGGEKGVEPVVGWLVCIEGEYYGESFNLKMGRNFIGRAQSMDIVLAKDNSVSRDKHAIVLYEPKKREFLAQPGDSRSLFYLNDEVVLMTEKLKKGDVLTLGNTKLMFIPCCGPDFAWE